MRNSRERDDDDRGHGRERGGRDSGEERGSSRRGGDGGGRRFQYQARDADDAKRRAEGGDNFDKYINGAIKMFKPSDGNNNIRILPPTWEGAKHWGHDVWVHYGVGPDRQTYLCPHKMNGDPCPICEEREEAANDGDEKYAKDLAPKRRSLVYLLDRDNEKEGVMAWGMPPTLDRDIVKVSIDKKSGEVLNIDHPDDGYDVSFEKKGAKERTEYLAPSIDRRSSDLGRDGDKWLDFCVDNPLPDQLVFFDYDHIARAFGGAGAHRNNRDRDTDSNRGNDRDERGSSRSSGREDRSSSRDSARDADDRGNAGRRGDRDSRGRVEPELTWESVHEMSGRELEDLIETQDLDIKPDEAKDDEDLADWICEELKLKKAEPETRSRRRVVTDDAKDDGGDTSERLNRMRSRVRE